MKKMFMWVSLGIAMCLGTTVVADHDHGHDYGEKKQAEKKKAPKKEKKLKKDKMEYEYVCPMACARSDKPGDCEKCGMTLEKKTKARKIEKK